MNWSKVLRIMYVLVAISLAYGRASGEKGKAFQAVAHLFDGFLFGQWKRFEVGLAITLALIELACFLLKV